MLEELSQRVQDLIEYLRSRLVARLTWVAIGDEIHEVIAYDAIGQRLPFEIVREVYGIENTLDELEILFEYQDGLYELRVQQGLGFKLKVARLGDAWIPRPTVKVCLDEEPQVIELES